MVELLQIELGDTAEQTTQWMRAAVAAGNELSESRLKGLIKIEGGTQALPKKRTGANATKLSKGDYLTKLVDMLRISNHNDYRKVSLILQAQTKSSGKKKGFGGK